MVRSERTQVELETYMYEYTRPLDLTFPHHRRDLSFVKNRPKKKKGMTELQYLLELDLYEKNRKLNAQ